MTEPDCSDASPRESVVVAFSSGYDTFKCDLPIWELVEKLLKECNCAVIVHDMTFVEVYDTWRE